MECVRSAIVLLVLSLSLIAVRDALAFARKELEATTYTERAIGRAQELREEIRSTSATQSQGIRGRKMGVKDEVKKELTKVKSSVITGMVEIASRKPFGSSNAKEIRSSTKESRPSTTLNKKIEGNALEPVSPSSIHANLESSKEPKQLSTHGLYEPFQTIDPQKLKVVDAELFKMLNKDYHDKARRRPPINNNVEP